MTDLTKWPRLIVVGEKVTGEQANEILVRTFHWHYFSTNDHEWERMVANLVGAPPDYHEATIKNGMSSEDWHALQDEFLATMHELDLAYLYNERIMSSWIGGPHGWCDWDGTIGTSEYNIGKWPSIQDVTEDWKEIAEAFPFLTLTSQLVPDEGDAEMSVVRFEIAEGTVSVIEKEEPLLRQPEELDLERMLNTVRHRNGERGVDFQRLAEAVRQVRNK